MVLDDGPAVELVRYGVAEDIVGRDVVGSDVAIGSSVVES